MSERRQKMKYIFLGSVYYITRLPQTYQGWIDPSGVRIMNVAQFIEHETVLFRRQVAQRKTKFKSTMPWVIL